MHVIEISLDHSLFATGPSIGDSLWRQRQYATVLGELSIVVYSLRSRGNVLRQIEDRLTLYPTSSVSRLTLPLDAYAVASRLTSARRAALCIVQDPFATGLAGYLLRLRYGIPLNVGVFSSFFGNPAWIRERPENRVLHELGKFVVRHADTVRVQSTIERDGLIRLGVAPTRIWVVPLLVDLERFSRADGGAIRARYPGRKIVLFAGRLAPEKSVDVLVDTMSILRRTQPDGMLLIVGDGSERSRLERRASRLGLKNVVFVGVVGGHELPQYFAAADVVALSSTYEGVPTVLIEAAAAGRVSVATPTRNISEVLLDGVSGFVVPSEAAAFADRIDAIFTSPEQQRSMGEAARALAFERFDPGVTLSRLREMWLATAREDR